MITNSRTPAIGPSILAKIRPTNVVTFSKTQPHYATKTDTRQCPLRPVSVIGIRGYKVDCQTFLASTDGVPEKHL